MRRIFIPLLAMCLLVPFGAGAAETGPRVVVEDGDPSGEIELVGHSALGNRGMNAALAIHGDYAYVGSRTDGTHPNAGIMIVDIKDPETPEVVGQIGPPDVGNRGETSREMRVWPEEDILIVLNLASNCSYLIHLCSPESATKSDTYLFFDISGDKAAAPELLSSFVPDKSPHEFFIWDDPKKKGRTLMYQSNTSAGVQFTVTDISGAREGKFTDIAEFQTLITTPGDNRLHSMTVTNNGKRVHIAALGGGYLEADSSQVAAGKRKPKIKLVTNMADHPTWGNPGAHSAVKFYGRDYVLAADEVYGYAPGLLADHGCPWGWVRIIDIRNHKKPKVISEFKLEENTQEFCDSPTDNDPVRNSTSSYSAHNPTLTRNLAVMSWHAGGLQVLDISNPAKPGQAAEYVPEPLPYVLREDPVLTSGHDKVAMWSFPIIRDGLIYVTDIRNGLYILRYKGPFEKEIDSVRFLEGNSNFGDALKLEKP
ncbi:MAG: LVIVD repeat-containing protein [Actinomycetota bacterium]